MDKNAFSDQLQQDGFEIVTVTMPSGERELHSHPFEARALIVAGEITIATAENERRYQVGDVFHLQPGVPHTERYGPDGVEYLVGRKSS
ncbi:MAG: hypothetical protein JWP36_1418 [Paucimonas sp.]|jgi:quercetin dioxygenase-like cupin family protein|nr:hypothetical protein [Paucimonas sp.]